jgi:hypothetical protein
MASENSPPPQRRAALAEIRQPGLAEIRQPGLAEIPVDDGAPRPASAPPKPATRPPPSPAEWGDYGPPPTLDATLLTRARSEREPPFFVLVAEARVPAYLRAPESWAAFQSRRDRVRDDIMRLQAFPGPTQQPAQTFLRSEAWRQLSALDEKTFTSTCENLARAHYELSIRAFGDEVESRIVDDMRLSLPEQFLLGERSAALGIPDDEARRIIDAKCNAHGIKREKNSPLRRRNDGEITDVLELRRAADTEPNVVVADLKDAIQKDKLDGWLKPLGTTGAFAETARRVGETYYRVHASGTLDETTLNVWCWELIWDAGIHWIDLTWQGAVAEARRTRSASRVDEVLALLTKVKRSTAEVLYEVLAQKLLSPWLCRKPAIPETAMKAALEAEKGWGQFTDTQKTLHAHRVAWSLGENTLRGPDKARVRTAAEFAQLTLGNWVTPLVEQRLLHGWLELVLKRPDIVEGVDRLTGAAATPINVAQFAQWRLGRRDVNLGAFRCEGPDRDRVVESALRSDATFHAFGTAIADGTLLAWLQGTDATDPRLLRLSKIKSGSVADRRALAQLGLAELEDRRFPVFTNASVQFINNRADFVTLAHRYWSYLGAAADLPRLEKWLEVIGSIVRAPDPTLKTSWPVGALLMAAGDTTIRTIEGVPVGQEDGRKPTQETASAVRADFIAWLESGGASRAPSVARAALDGGLLHWLRVYDPAAHRSLEAQLASRSDDQGRIIITLWAFGFSHLMLSDRVTVRNATELAAVARHHLVEIETLFDNRLLEGWAQGHARERLAALSAQVDEATTRLAAFDEPNSPVCPAWVRERLGEDAGLVVFRPLDWLLLRDRAALAVGALGGVLSQRAAVPTDQVIIDMPLDVDLNLPIGLGPTTRGDVPTHAILRTVADGMPRCDVISSDDPDVAIAHFPQAEIDGKGARFSLGLALLQVQPTGAPSETPTAIDVRMASGTQRLARGLKTGALLSLIGIVIGGLLGMGYGGAVLALLPSLTTTSTGFTRLEMGRPAHGFLGLFTALVALLPLYTLRRFGRHTRHRNNAKLPRAENAALIGTLVFFFVVVAWPLFVAIGEVGSFVIWNHGNAASRFLPALGTPAYAGTVLLFMATGALTGHLIGMLRARATGYALGSAAAGLTFLAGLSGLF